MTTVKERPILFKGDMVRAILEGRKTQTRRVVKPQPRGVFAGYKDSMGYPASEGHVWAGFGDGSPVYYKCPFGKPGDRLWVREAHSIHMAHGQHRHDGKRWGPWGGLENTVSPDGTKIAYYREGFDRCAPRWRPSIHMPRWASRILLEVVSVRVERLQDISEEDAVAEGIAPWAFQTTKGHHSHAGLCRTCGQKRGQHVGAVHACPGGTGTTFSTATAVGGYSYLWDSLAAPGVTWADNPWVWAVEFKRVEVQS